MLTCGGTNEMAPLTPAIAKALGDAFTIMRDDFFEDWVLVDKASITNDKSLIEDTTLYSLLPPTGQEAFKKNRHLLKDFVTTLDTLALKVLGANTYELGSRAEELLLDWVIEEAKAILEASDKLTPKLEKALDDYLHDVNEDMDHRLLYWDQKEMNPEAVREMAVGSLSFENWFLPYHGDMVTNPLTWPENKAYWHPNWANFQYPEPGEN